MSPPAVTLAGMLKMALPACIGGCVPVFLLAAVFDVAGLVLLFVGIFANVRVGDRFYGDFLIYTGSLVIFISLGFWVMWYVWNVPASDDYGPRRSDSVVVKLARKLTERLSRKLNAEERLKPAEDGTDSQISPAPRKASRVTWGRSTAYQNEGYEDSPDSPAVEKKVQTEEEPGHAM